jgi:uncharacterized membrane protein YoaK (UPF0700 family)
LLPETTLLVTGLRDRSYERVDPRRVLRFEPILSEEMLSPASIEDSALQILMSGDCCPRTCLEFGVNRPGNIRQAEIFMARPSLGVLLSFNGGYVDTMGFLALAGLFTAHVTGNFVTLGAALVFGTTGIVAKLLALPVFCVVIVLSTLLSLRFKLAGRRAIVTLLSIKFVLFTIAAVAAFVHGPVSNGDSPAAIAIGMTLVTAMAIQNALHRAHLSKLPPTTLMTGTTTQIMIDLAELMSGTATDHVREVKERLKRMATSLLSFAIGCTAAALAFVASPTWCFVLPPVLVALCFLTPSGDPSEE